VATLGVSFFLSTILLDGVPFAEGRIFVRLQAQIVLAPGGIIVFGHTRLRPGNLPWLLWYGTSSVVNTNRWGEGMGPALFTADPETVTAAFAKGPSGAEDYLVVLVNGWEDPATNPIAAAFDLTLFEWNPNG
jgi:hypothetical protein